MTEGYQPYSAVNAETEYLPPVMPDAGSYAATEGGSGGADQKTTEVAKDQAADLKQGTVEAGQHVASVAKDQASNVTAEAGRQAKDLLGQARSELSQQASAQQQRVADGLRSLSQQLHSMSEHSDEPGIAADLAKQGAHVTEQAASWFDGGDPGAMLNEVRSFARRRPGTFLLMAAGAGMLAGRLTRGLKDEASSDSEDGSQGSAGGLTSGTNGVGSFTAPGTAELTSGSLAGPTGLTGGASYSAPPTVPIVDEPVPYVSQDGELGYPSTGNTL
jgi:hypothetical protein